MTDLLIGLGILFIGVAFWSGRGQSAAREKEIAELKHVRDEVRVATKEVNTLLKQMESVSEKAVEEISAKIEEAKKLARDRVLPDRGEISGHSARAVGFPEVLQEQVSGSKSSGGDMVKNKSRNNTVIFPKVKGGQATTADLGNASEEPKRETVPRQQMVLGMAKLGLSDEEIARQLKMGRGEVSLMLKLRGKGEEANG